MSDAGTASKVPPKSAGQADERTSKAGVVTLLDVLGWKGIYNREPSPIHKLSSLINDVLDAKKRFRGLKATAEVRSISDTLIVYSTGVALSDAGPVIDMHGAICGHAIAASIRSRLPLRGATAYGDFEVMESIYVGKAIDEAASWYESGDWIGVHLTPSALFAIDAPLANWVDYQPPLKAGAKHVTPCVRWANAWKESVPGQDPRRLLQTTFRDMGPITPDIAMKFVNTLAYFDASHRREEP